MLKANTDTDAEGRPVTADQAREFILRLRPDQVLAAFSEHPLTGQSGIRFNPAHRDEVRREYGYDPGSQEFNLDFITGVLDRLKDSGQAWLSTGSIVRVLDAKDNVLLAAYVRVSEALIHMSRQRR